MNFKFKKQEINYSSKIDSNNIINTSQSLVEMNKNINISNTIDNSNNSNTIITTKWLEDFLSYQLSFNEQEDKNYKILFFITILLFVPLFLVNPGFTIASLSIFLLIYTSFASFKSFKKDLVYFDHLKTLNDQQIIDLLNIVQNMKPQFVHKELGLFEHSYLEQCFLNLDNFKNDIVNKKINSNLKSKIFLNLITLRKYFHFPFFNEK